MSDALASALNVAADVVVAIVALIHVYTLILEMFLWTKPTGLRVFRLTREQAESSKVLAQNQGLYNGFLAVGLAWGLAHPTPTIGAQIKFFFLGCVLVAGIYGGWTVGRKILYVQALPAAVAIALLLLAR